MGRPRSSKKKSPKPVIEEAKYFKLDDVKRLTLCRFEAEVRAAKNQLQSEQVYLAQYLTSIDKEGSIPKRQMAIQALSAQVSLMQTRYEEARKQIETEFNIDLKNYSFDDETGILHLVGPASPGTS